MKLQGFMLVMIFSAALHCCTPGHDASRTLDYGDDARAASEAWEALRGPLPVRCHNISDLVIVAELTRGELASVCPTAEPGIVVGCFLAPMPGVDTEPIIYIASDVDASLRSDSAIHEWVHALAWCALGSSDSEHADASLWEPPGVWWEAIARR